MKQLLTLATLAVWPPLAAQNQKDLLQALRQDVAALREENRKTKAAQDERLAVLYESLSKTFDLVTRINEKMAATQASTADQMRAIVGESGTPLRELTQKVDTLGDQYANLSNAIAEVNARLAKFDSKLEDMRKAIQTIPAPQEAPPVSSGEKLYDDANRDNLGGNADLALQGFTAYLDKFKDSTRAPDAQFFIAGIHLGKGDLESALKAYDALLWTYPQSGRAPNAHFMKGVVLLKLERRTEAAVEFRIVTERYPGSELAARAKDYLKEMAVPVKPAPAKKNSPQRH